VENFILEPFVTGAGKQHCWFCYWSDTNCSTLQDKK